MNRIQNSKSKKGFTLVELSIVLVIIGLIVSGVLVGQDLIEAARVRAQIQQINNYDTAVNAFRAKYEGLPGDLSGPLSFGLVAADPDAGTQGNGIVEGAIDTATTETRVFYESLSGAGMIGGSYAAGSTPTTKMDVGGISVFNDGSYNWFALGTAATSGASADDWGQGFTAFVAWTIDTKVDDGLPNDGIFRAADDAGSGIDANGLIAASVNVTANTGCAVSTAATAAYIVANVGTRSCPAGRRL